MNSLLIVLTAAVVIVLGATSFPELLIGIWVENYDPHVPLVPIAAIIMGGGLLCVLLLVLVEPLLQAKREEGDD